MVSEPERLALLQALERSLGASPAHTLMSLLPPFDWTEVARQSDLVALRADVTGVRAELATVRAELKVDIADLRTELKVDIADLRTEVKGDIAALRTELKGDIAGLRTELTSKINAQLPRLIWANIGMLIAFSGLLFAAVKLV